MKAKKLDRNVSNMNVLQDIRGLLSATEKGEAAQEAQSGSQVEIKAETAHFEEQLRHYQELVKQQQEQISRLENEKKELTARLNTPQPEKDKPVAQMAGTRELSQEIARLEAQKAELSAGLSQIEGLLQLSLKDLLKRIARVFDEAGQGEIALEFRRSANQLEVAENFANFVRVLLRE
ncbi:MAG: hypothetical protein ABIH70_04400 [Chloroflexota bacterium]